MMREFDIEGKIQQIADTLRKTLAEQNIKQPVMVGIHSGGVWIAEYLHRLLEIESPLGTLDISFYRDDFTRIGMNPQVKPSNIPFEIDNRHIILVDDVLHTGRTIRAALNEIFDYGRPASVTLVALIERSGRELPIEARIVGQHMTLGDDEHIKLSGPQPLSLTLVKAQKPSAA